MKKITLFLIFCCTFLFSQAQLEDTWLRQRVGANWDLHKKWSVYGFYRMDLEDNLQSFRRSNIQLGAKLIVGKKYVVSTDTKNTQTKKENIAVNDRNEVKLYYVKKGDSLFSIAKKYPGVSISDLKKWNGIKNERLKAGMKLKING